MPVNLSKPVSHNCIIIGSGSDLNGRRLGEMIDSGVFGEVIRINRRYGSPVDVGTKTDIVFRVEWDTFGTAPSGCRIIVPYTQEGISHSVCAGTGLEHPTTGMQAVFWAMEHKYRPVVIGFGFRRGKRVNANKTYVDGRVEFDGWHNFTKENEILLKWNREKKINLL